MLHMKYNGKIDPCQVQEKFKTHESTSIFLHITPWKIILQKNYLYAFCGTYMLLKYDFIYITQPT